MVASLSQAKPVVLRSGSSGYSLTHGSGCVRLRSNSSSSAELISSCVGAGSLVLNRVGHCDERMRQFVACLELDYSFSVV